MMRCTPRKDLFLFLFLFFFRGTSEIYFYFIFGGRPLGKMRENDERETGDICT